MRFDENHASSTVAGLCLRIGRKVKKFEVIETRMVRKLACGEDQAADR